MPKQRNNQRAKKSFTPIKRAALKIAAFLVVISLAVLSMLAAVSYAFRNSDYFRIKEVMLSEDNIADLSYLKGENIFALDLDKESIYILEHYPSYSSVRLIRILPNRIYAFFIKRKPLAVVKLYRVFSVDKDMVLFELPEGQQEIDMPVITGLETKIFGPKTGVKYNVRELAFALNTLKAFRYNRVLRFYRVKRIDVSNISSASVFVESPFKQALVTKTGAQISPGLIEIKLGENWLRDKIGILAMILTEGKSDLPNINYIDLRFRDPLIKLKDNNAK